MNKKLTLMLDDKVIDRAKRYAHGKNESLSQIVAEYFTYLTGKVSSENQNGSLPDEIEKIIGIIKIPDELDVKKDYREGRAGKTVND